jgi:hypothetical protein
MRPRLEEVLGGGDRRSIGQVGLVVARLRRQPALLAEVVAAVRSSKPLVAMRAADALEKLSRARADQLAPYRTRLLRAAVATRDPVVRWNLIQLLPRLPCGRPAETRLARRLEVWYLTDRSAIVRASALEAIVELTTRNESVQPVADRMMADALTAPSAAIRARARRLAPRWPAASPRPA